MDVKMMNSMQIIAPASREFVLSVGDCNPMPRCLEAVTEVTVSYTTLGGDVIVNRPMAAGKTLVVIVKSVEALTGTLHGLL